MSDRDYVMSIESKVKTGYGRGFKDACDLIDEFIHDTYKSYEKRTELKTIFDTAVNNYFEHCGNGNDAKLRILPRSREYIAGVIKGEV